MLSEFRGLSILQTEAIQSQLVWYVYSLVEQLLGITHCPVSLSRMVPFAQTQPGMQISLQIGLRLLHVGEQ